MKHAYTCAFCQTIYDPAAQGHCPHCGKHPHLEGDCDHDCDTCSSVLFPPKDGHLDLFRPAGAAWQRVVRSEEAPHTQDDALFDRGVDVALLAAEIEVLRESALRYSNAVAEGRGVGGAGLDLEAAALRYVRKLDDEQRKANAIDYGKIAEQALRDRETGNN